MSIHLAFVSEYVAVPSEALDWLIDHKIAEVTVIEIPDDTEEGEQFLLCFGEGEQHKWEHLLRRFSGRLAIII